MYRFIAVALLIVGWYVTPIIAQASHEPLVAGEVTQFGVEGKACQTQIWAEQALSHIEEVPYTEWFSNFKANVAKDVCLRGIVELVPIETVKNDDGTDKTFTDMDGEVWYIIKSAPIGWPAHIYQMLADMNGDPVIFLLSVNPLVDVAPNVEPSGFVIDPESEEDV